MPGFVTHYIFGTEAYRRQSHPTLKRTLHTHNAAYALGLQGPDIFFYYLPSYVLHGHNIGALAHTSGTNAFFHGLLHGYRQLSAPADRRIAEAYLTGYLGHYLLDTTCHPYIYAMTHFTGRTKDYFSRHAYLETDIDTALLALKLHRRPGNFFIGDTMRLTARQKRVITDLLWYAYHYAFPEYRLHRFTMRLGIFSIRLGLRILRDRSGQKKVLFRFLEKHFLGYPLFSPLIASDTLFFRTDPFNLRHASWTNPWDSGLVSTESFFDLYRRAMRRYVAMTQTLHDALSADGADAARKIRAFLEEYQNLSFHSGLDVSIPS